MKKWIALLLILSILSALSACREDLHTEDPVTTVTAETDRNPEVETDDTQPDLREVKLITSAAYLCDYDSEISSEYRYEWEEDHLRVNCYLDDAPQWSHELYDTDPPMAHWKYYYDGDGKLVESAEYSQSGCMMSQTFPRDEGGQWVYAYNDQEMPISATLVQADGTSIVEETWVYDDRGLLLEHMEYGAERDDEDSVYEVTVQHTWDYDQAGQPLQYTTYEADTLMYIENWVYDSQGNVLEHNSQEYGDYEAYSNTVNTYNEAGQLIESVRNGDDPANHWNYRSVFSYDQAGNLIKEVSTHEYGDVITDTWTYDEAGNLLSSVTHYQMDGWITCLTENTYDENGRMIEGAYRELYDDQVLTGYRTTYAHDEGGNLIEEVYYGEDEEPLRTTYQYDTQGNCIQKTEYEGDQETDLFRWSYDENGNLLDVETMELESLAAFGDEVLVRTTESGEVYYVAVKYETIRVEDRHVREFEEKNGYILSVL